MKRALPSNRSGPETDRHAFMGKTIILTSLTSQVSSKQFALPPPPSGPDSDKPLLKSVSGAQSLEVSRKGAGGSQMEILSPHSGFDMAAAIEVD